MVHQQRSQARLSPTSDTEDIRDASSLLAPRLAYFAGGRPHRARHPRRAGDAASRSPRCPGPWSGSNRTWASTCSPATAAPSPSPPPAAPSSAPSNAPSPRSERAADAVRADADPATGKVAFGFLHTMGSETVPGLIRAFRADHPRVRFSLVQNYGEAMIERLRAGELDLCLTSPVPDAPDLVARRLDEQKLRLVVPDDHRLAGPPAHPPRRGGRRDLRDPGTRLRPAPHHRRPLRGGRLHARGSPSRARRRRPCAAWWRQASGSPCCRHRPCPAREWSS